MKKRKVITAFLQHNGKILLLRRSRRVGSYQGRWAGISGYLEDKSPLEQAWREIREETGLSQDGVRLINVGRPLEILDEALRVCWEVHPFLFEVESPEKITLDWEHEEMRWILPEDLDSYETVPALAKALAACLEKHPANEGRRQ